MAVFFFLVFGGFADVETAKCSEVQPWRNIFDATTVYKN
jgi:hypothetical protein